MNLKFISSYSVPFFLKTSPQCNALMFLSLDGGNQNCELLLLDVTQCTIGKAGN